MTYGFSKHLPTGYEVVDYKGYRQRMILKCDNDHEFESSPKFTVFMCPECKPNILKKKLQTPERLVWVNEKLGEFGFKYIDGDLTDLKVRMTVECLVCETQRENFIFRNKYKTACSVCRDSKTSKENLELVKPKIQTIGYKILRTYGAYRSAADTKFDLQCYQCDETRVSTYNNLKKHPECRKCQEAANIKKKIKEHGFSYIDHHSVKYDDKTKFHKVTAVCEKGHEQTKLVANYDKPCKICHPKTPVWRVETIREWLQEHHPHIQLLGFDPNTVRASLQCQKDQYVFVTNWYKFSHAKSNCPKCSKSARLTPEEIRAVYEKEGFQVEVTEETTARDKIPTVCPRGHNFLSNIIRFRDRGDRCIQCYREDKASKGEIKFMNWLESEGFIVHRNDRFELEGLEIDGFIPEHRVGIEHNGLYYHSITRKPDINRHKDKYLKALEKGIFLFQFWEDEFIHKEEIIQSMVLTKLKSPKVTRIYGRKCEVREVPIKEAREFLDENHLQGGYGHSAMGLYYESELVMVVTYGRHHRGGEDIVLQRLASKKLTVVIGGMSKLVTKMPRPLVTWSDNRYSQGSSYEQAGFIMDSELRPDYQYFRNEGRYKYTRYSKQSLKLKPEEKGLGKTEAVLRAEQNYHRIYDAGKKRWRLD